MSIYESAFSLGDKVIVDGDADLIAVVTAIQFRSAAPSVEVSYFSGGKHEAVFLEPWRLKKVEK